MKAAIHFLLTAFFLFNLNLTIAQINDPQEPTFHFQVNEKKLTDDYAAHWEEEYNYGYNDFHNQNKKVILHSYSSANEYQYNKQLGRIRAKALKKYLIQKGVPASRIKIVVHGETIMAGEDNYSETSETIRQVIVVFQDLPAATTAADPINDYKDKNHLQGDIAEGEKIFKKIIEVEVKKIKKNHKMVSKVFLQNPSANPEELANQIYPLLTEMAGISKLKKNPAKMAGATATFIAQVGIDAFIDLFTSLQAGEVNKARQVKYDVIIEALTVVCFPGYDAEIAGYNIDQRMLYHSLIERLKVLNNADKYMLRAMVIAGPTFSMDTFYTAEKRFNEHMQDTWMFQRNLKNRFQKSKYRYRD